MRAYLLLIVFFYVAVANSQGFRARHTMPGGLDNAAMAIFESQPGKYIALGHSYDSLNGYNVSRLTVLGLGTNGELLWSKKYGNHKFEYLINHQIRKTAYKTGNYVYYSGCARDTSGKQIGFLIKFDLSGDSVWQKIYRESDPDEDVIPHNVSKSTDGGFLITGFFQHWTLNVRRCLLIKTDANGNELWRKKISKSIPNTQSGNAILQDSATKKVVIVGYQYIGTSMKDNILILDSLGNVISQHTYAGFGGYNVDLIQTSDGKFVVTGNSDKAEMVGGYNLMRAFAAKFDVNNPLIPTWVINNFGRPAFTNVFHSVLELGKGELMMAGVYDSAEMDNNMENTLCRLTRVDKNGKILWNRTYDYKINSPHDPYSQSLLMFSPVSDGGFVAAIKLFNAQPNPFFFVKFDSTGCDSTLDYCATVNNVGLADFLEEGNNFKIYPNPANDHLEFELPPELSSMELNYAIYSYLGSLIREEGIRLDEKTSLDMSQLNPGVYSLVLKVPEGYSITKKFVIAR